MTESFLDKLRKIPSFSTAIISSVTLFKANNTVTVAIITDKTYSAEDEASAREAVRQYVPSLFECDLQITKLAPDCQMVADKITEIINRTNRRLSAFVSAGDVKVHREENGFYFTMAVINASDYSSDVISAIVAELQKCFCGRFVGKLVDVPVKTDDIVIDETPENVRYEIPPRTFGIEDLELLEGTDEPKSAIYIADLNFTAESVVICGKITDVREREVSNSKGKQRTMFTFTVDDTTATKSVGYFARQKSIDKIRNLKVGDSVVLTCKTELYNGNIRATAIYIDKGKAPQGFVPEKRASKPVPKYYEHVFPEPYVDFTQSDLFAEQSLPKCLTDNVFVVFDLETTGLNSSPSSGNMDRIIEIGAYKIIDGEIKESFNTFVNPSRKLSQEIIDLTGIEQETVDGAPVYEAVMPDFYKFIDGAYLVGHNVANFDYKFVEYYCSLCGYATERKMFDTLLMARDVLPLSNYKLNTVADHFGIKFNHHRAADDALVTAKIFIELIKIKKTLPNLC